MPARVLHLLPSSEPCAARNWLLELLNQPTNSPDDASYAVSRPAILPHDAASAAAKHLGDPLSWPDGAIYVTTVAGDSTPHVHLPAVLDRHWLPLARRPRDPLRWWRLLRFMQSQQPEVIRFWFAPNPWLRRLCRFASPRSRWQVVFRSAGELPTAIDRSWSALDTAWYDNPLLLERSGSALAHAGKALLPWPSAASIANAPEGSQGVNPWALRDSSNDSRAELRKNLLSRLQLPQESILLITMGPLERQKNQDQLFWSLDQLSCTRDDVRLLVIGDGPDRARLEHHARLHHVEQRLVWLGTVDSPTEYLRAADLYISADPRERISRAMLEARAVGLPIIAHDTATNRQIVTAPEHGKLVDPTYLADFAGAMYRWLNAKAVATP